MSMLFAASNPERVDEPGALRHRGALRVGARLPVRLDAGSRRSRRPARWRTGDRAWCSAAPASSRTTTCAARGLHRTIRAQRVHAERRRRDHAAQHRDRHSRRAAGVRGAHARRAHDAAIRPYRSSSAATSATTSRARASSSCPVTSTPLARRTSNPSLDVILEFLVGTHARPSERTRSSRRCSSPTSSRRRRTLPSSVTAGGAACSTGTTQTSRRIVERFGGRVVKQTGDGLLATFDGPGAGRRSVRRPLRDALASDRPDPRRPAHRRGRAPGRRRRRDRRAHRGARVAALAGVGRHPRVEDRARPRRRLRPDFEDRGTHELKGVPGHRQLVHAALGEGDDAGASRGS